MTIRDVVEITSHGNDLVLHTKSGVDVIINNTAAPSYVIVESFLNEDKKLEPMVICRWDD